MKSCYIESDTWCQNHVESNLYVFASVDLFFIFRSESFFCPFKNTASNIIWHYCHLILDTWCMYNRNYMFRSNSIYICWYQNAQIPITGNRHASTRIRISTRAGTCPYQYWNLYLEMRHHLHFLFFSYHFTYLPP